jgi:DNA-binding CsgD family transcriptional regulator
LLREGAARVLIAQGRPAEALEELSAPVDHPEVVNPAWAPWRGLKARVLADLGRGGEALALADEEVALLRRWGAPSSLGPALRLRGELRGELGRADGTADLREAVDVLAGTRAVLEAARAGVSLGCLPQVADAEAVPLLESALEVARTCGAQGVVAAAAAALTRRGRSPVDHGDAPTRLTGRQRRVSELAAAGLDVNEVAQRLFLTPGTVRSVLQSTGEPAP